MYRQKYTIGQFHKNGDLFHLEGYKQVLSGKPICFVNGIVFCLGNVC